MKKLVAVVLVFLSASFINMAQENNIDVFVIDSYITQEEPHHFILSFFSTGKVTSTVTLADEYSFTVSDTLAEDHKIEIDVSSYQFDSSYVNFFISGKDSLGNKYKSDEFEVVLPYKNKLESDENTSLLTVCCFGGIIFGLPSPTVVFRDEETSFSLVKEIPVLSFYSGGYNYPTGYISLEYAHIFNGEFRNFMRLGYKQVFEIPALEFVSAGMSGFTTFKGFNGFSPEVTIGWFKIYNAFTVYSKYRFNFQPSHSDRNFHEISIGLYSNFFSINF